MRNETPHQAIAAAVTPHLKREPDPAIVGSMALDDDVTYLLDMPTADADLVAEYRYREDEARRQGESTIQVRTGHRERALVSILEEDASNLPRVLEFRSAVLGGRLMTQDEVPGWIESASERDGPPTRWELVPRNPEAQPAIPRERLDQVRTGPNGWRPMVRRVETLAFVGTGGRDVERVQINAWGDLGLLKTVAEDVSALARIAEWWAVQFVLTGQLRIPQATYTLTSNSRFPALDRVLLDLALSVSTSTATLLHREALQLAERPARMRDIDERHATMAILAHRYNDGRTWPDLLDEYVRVRGADHDIPSNFDRDCTEAYRKVTGRELNWKNARGRPSKRRETPEESA